MNKLMSAALATALGKKVDRLGLLNASIAKLEAEAAGIKAALKASGLGEVKGTLFRAVVTSKDVARLDSATVKSMLTPTELAKATVVSKVVSVSLYDL